METLNLVTSPYGGILIFAFAQSGLPGWASEYYFCLWIKWSYKTYQTMSQSIELVVYTIALLTRTPLFHYWRIFDLV